MDRNKAVSGTYRDKESSSASFLEALSSSEVICVSTCMPGVGGRFAGQYDLYARSPDRLETKLPALFILIAPYIVVLTISDINIYS